MRVTSFGSGSNGNAFLVQAGSTALLIDAGVPIRLLRSGLQHAGIGDGELTATFITHEHVDHVRAAAQLCRYQPVPFLATEGTIGELRHCRADWTRIRATVSMRIGEIDVTPVAVSHDAADPVGFVVEHGGVRVSLFTDLGETTVDVCSALSDASLIVLESNYDEQMLRSGPYPAHLKRRIRGPRGHLGNADCGELLAAHMGERTSDVWLAHLSDKNNRPEIARASAEACLGGAATCPTITPVPRFGSSITWDSQQVVVRPRQTSLF
jgi:phosphoribosyl 1,2-cyclic phosphodiesterase